MADIDFNNIFGDNNTDISKILFDENQLSIIRDQFKKEIIDPLFIKYQNFSYELQNKLSQKLNDKSFIEDYTDILGIKKYKKNINIDKKLDDIVNPFISKLSNYYDNISKSLDDFSNFKFLPDINFTNLNEKIKEKISNIENILNDTEIKIPKKRSRSKLKERSEVLPVESISETIENYLSTRNIEPKKEIESSKPPENTLPSIEPKKEIEPFTLKDFHDEFVNNITILIEDISKIRENLEISNNNIFSIKNFISEYIPKIQNNSDEDSNNEQKTIGDSIKETDLSEKTINRIKDIFIGLNVFDKKEEFMGVSTLSSLQKDTESSGFWSDLLLKVGVLLLTGGLLMTAIGPLWDNMIKPYLEDFLGVKIKTFDDILGRFSKIWEGMEKWFTLGGISGVGFGLKIRGKIFETISDLLEHSIGGIFGKVGEEALGKGAVEVSTFLPKIGAKLFGGLSKTMLKAIPFVGSLFSFYFAKQDYDSGDYIGMGFNIASGIANLIPVYGTAISLGLDVLNAILEFNTGGAETMEQKQGMKIDFLGKMIDFIQEIPLIGGLIKWGKGIYALGQGNRKEALEYLAETPFLGPIPAIIQALDNSGAFGDPDKNFSFDTFSNELKKSMFRFICSFVPKVGGLRGAIAGWMGLSYDDNTGKVEIDETNFYNESTGLLKSPEQIIAEKNYNKILNETGKSYDTSPEALEKTKKIKEELENTVKNYETQLRDVIRSRVDPITPFFGKLFGGMSRDEIIEQQLQSPANINGMSYEESELKQKLATAKIQLDAIKLQRNKQLGQEVGEKLDAKRNEENKEIFGEENNDEDNLIEEFGKPKKQKANDFFDYSNDSFSDISNISKGKYYYNPENNTKTYLNQNDQVYAMQRGGIIEETINKQLGEFTNILLTGLRELKENSSGGSFLNNPVNNITVTSVSNGNSNDSYTTGKRDPIFDLRTDWWKSSTMERIY